MPQNDGLSPDDQPADVAAQRSRRGRIALDLASLLPAFIGVIGVIIGGYIANTSAVTVAHDGKIQDVKNTAYLDFGNAQATYIALSEMQKQLAAMARQDPAAPSEAGQARAGGATAVEARALPLDDADGKTAPSGKEGAPATLDEQIEAVTVTIRRAMVRIAMFGDPEVVHRIGDFLRTDGIRRPRCMPIDDSDIAMYTTIREKFSGAAVDKATRSDVALIILNCVIAPPPPAPH